jgi:hypothetical protein
MAEGLAFLQGELGKSLALPRHPPDFAHHALADGGRGPAHGEASRAFLRKLFANTRRVLGMPLRMWPARRRVRAGAGVLPLGHSSSLTESAFNPSRA